MGHVRTVRGGRVAVASTQTNGSVVRMDHRQGRPVIVLDGTPSPACADALQAAACEAAGAGTDVLLDCKAADRIDACTLQLVVALAREVEAGGHRLLTAAPPPDAALIALAGVEWPPVADPAWPPDEAPPEETPIAVADDRPRQARPRQRRVSKGRKVREDKGSES